ncbi:hypothetical protein [Prosthecobacter sp.]|uniref:hypothetical protein n=1 Tax=Prosthecobacter sp. TaxID=1965333 RepID=UPI001E0CC572|nr:hypothetical protein [Prosthecobacter sp.]MCB1275686.1 hypothetical protein [Prosthecobacter sp.]
MKRVLFTLAAFTAVCAAQSPETPTHQEIAPIKIPLGEEGTLKTISMDRRGNLLVGVSFRAPAGAVAAAKPKLMDRLSEASRAGDAKAWDKVVTEATVEELQEAMMSADQETRGEIMNLLSQEKRDAVTQAMRGGRRGIRDMNPDARGGISPQLSTDHEGHAYELKVVSPDGKVLSTWAMSDGLMPKMIFGCPDGAVYVAGGGKLAQFTEDGKLVKMVDTDAVCGQKATASGICADATHVYLALGMGNSTRATEDLYKFKRDLSEPKMIVERQFGCCSHIDLRVNAGELLIAENSRHRVNLFDLDGKPKTTWGQRDRSSIEGFTACCNPCNIDFGPGGVLYTAESGVGRVKKYSPDGKFLGLVGYVDTTKFDSGGQLAATSCYIPMEVNADASRIYVMDVRAAIIRVLAKKS